MEVSSFGAPNIVMDLDQLDAVIMEPDDSGEDMDDDASDEDQEEDEDKSDDEEVVEAMEGSEDEVYFNSFFSYNKSATQDFEKYLRKKM